MPINSPTGFLDITNATLRTSNLEAENLLINGGNIYVTSELEIDATVLNLENVTRKGNVSSNTIEITNATTGLVATGNIHALKFIGDGSQLSGITSSGGGSSNLHQVIENGNVTSNTVQFTNATTGIVATGNVEAAKFIGSGSHLTDIPSGAIIGTLSQWSDGANGDVYIASNVGIGNAHTLTSNTLQVGGNLYVRDTDANVLTVNGNVVASYFEGDGSKLSGIGTDLQGVTDNGNVTSNTVQFTNPTTGIVTTSNIQVGGTLNINTISAAAYHSLQAVTNLGNVTSNTVQFSNAITSLTADSNVVVTGNVTAGSFLGDGSELTTLNATTITSGTLDSARIPTLNQSTTGSAATLTTPRSIGGVDFDGSSSITPTTFGGATFSGDVAFDTNTLFVDASTNRVGLGTITPNSNLDVIGLATVSNCVTIGATKTFVVTVSGNYFIDGVERALLELQRGQTYIFDMSDGSNTGHPLAFSTAFTGSSSSYTTGVVSNHGTVASGSAGSKVTFSVPLDAPSSIYYYCTQHGSGMGSTGTASSISAAVELVVTGRVVATGNVTAGSFLGDGSELTALNAANITTGTLDAARVPTPTTFTTATFSGDVTVDTTTFHVDTTNSRVGVGLTNPSTKLHIGSGDVGIDRDQKFDFGAGYSANWYIKQKSADNKIYFERTGGGGNELVIDTTGNVGIGTLSPSYKLNVLTDTNYDGISLRDSTRELLKISKGNNGSYINMFESGVSKVNIATSGDTYFMGGDVGIGILSPNAKLDVNGNVGIAGYLKTGNPAFYAHKTGAGPADNSYITYDASLANLGNHMNVTAGTFTCPVAGIYTFTWGGLANNSNHIYRYYIRKNNSNIGDIHLRLDNTASGSEFGDGERTVMLSLAANDTIRIHYQDSSGSDADYGYNYTYLQGHLISYT